MVGWLYIIQLNRDWIKKVEGEIELQKYRDRVSFYVKAPSTASRGTSPLPCYTKTRRPPFSVLQYEAVSIFDAAANFRCGIWRASRNCFIFLLNVLTYTFSVLKIYNLYLFNQF